MPVNTFHLITTDLFPLAQQLGYSSNIHSSLMRGLAFISVWQGTTPYIEQAGTNVFLPLGSAEKRDQFNLYNVTYWFLNLCF